MNSKNNIAAIVVTYNRVNLLQECVNALLEQTNENMDILVIDNASTDNTREVLEKYISKQEIIYFNTGENLGGAGGFNYGIRKAYELGYEYFWLMDDDTIPERNSLDELMKADAFLNGNYGFLSSYVKWTDGGSCKMNMPVVHKKWTEKIPFIEQGLIRVETATFVSFFTRRDIVGKVGLPIKEFFIWSDDTNYCLRINKLGECYLVSRSVVLHKINVNSNADIITDESNRLQRYRFAFRNRYFNAKMQHNVLHYYKYVLKKAIGVIRHAKNAKMKRLYYLGQGFFQGITFNPEIEYVEKK